ncbi:Holliday junction resolvase RuvX [Candidatus Saccharibacteria bacterium]|nr:Holliday junction resolvase RuvX [Candidatus Saccharibacteria bacterium]
MDSPKIQEYLGVDVGAARIGIARGSNAARLAEPLKTVAAEEAVQELIDLAIASSASGIVIGLPRGLDGNETAQTELVRQWASQLQNKIKLPLYWQDEAMTSETAGKLQKSKIKNNTTDEHSLAAAIILQDFLDSPESDRVAV